MLNTIDDTAILDEPFHSVHRDRRGVGLGISTVGNHIEERHISCPRIVVISKEVGAFVCSYRGLERYGIGRDSCRRSTF